MWQTKLADAMLLPRRAIRQAFASPRHALLLHPQRTSLHTSPTPQPESQPDNSLPSSAQAAPEPAAADANKVFSLATNPLPSEPYYIERTPTRNLPVYQLAKAGGNLRMTRVRKVGGDAEALRGQLERFLEPRPEYVRINPINGHVEMKVSFSWGCLLRCLRGCADDGAWVGVV